MIESDTRTGRPAAHPDRYGRPRYNRPQHRNTQSQGARHAAPERHEEPETDHDHCRSAHLPELREHLDDPQEETGRTEQPEPQRAVLPAPSLFNRLPVMRHRNSVDGSDAEHNLRTAAYAAKLQASVTPAVAVKRPKPYRLQGERPILRKSKTLVFSGFFWNLKNHPNRFQDRRLRPLGHPSDARFCSVFRVFQFLRSPSVQ